MCAEESEGWYRGGEDTEVVPELYIFEVELNGAAVGGCFRVFAGSEAEE